MCLRGLADACACTMGCQSAEVSSPEQWGHSLQYIMLCASNTCRVIRLIKGAPLRTVRGLVCCTSRSGLFCVAMCSRCWMDGWRPDVLTDCSIELGYWGRLDVFECMHTCIVRSVVSHVPGFDVGVAFAASTVCRTPLIWPAPVVSYFSAFRLNSDGMKSTWSISRNQPVEFMPS